MIILPSPDVYGPLCSINQEKCQEREEALLKSPTLDSDGIHVESEHKFLLTAIYPILLLVRVSLSISTCIGNKCHEIKFNTFSCRTFHVGR